MIRHTDDSRVVIWSFDQAPPRLRKFFPGGRSQDWVAEVEPSLGARFVRWLHSQWHVTFSIKGRHEETNGRSIFLGALSLDEVLQRPRKQPQQVVFANQTRARSASLSRPV